jgi:hypothetical protein
MLRRSFASNLGGFISNALSRFSDGRLRSEQAQREQRTGFERATTKHRSSVAPRDPRAKPLERAAQGSSAGMFQASSCVEVPSSRMTIFTGALPGANRYMCRTSIALFAGAGVFVRGATFATASSCSTAHPLKRARHKNKSKERMLRFLLRAERSRPRLERA